MAVLPHHATKTSYASPQTTQMSDVIAHQQDIDEHSHIKEGSAVFQADKAVESFLRVYDYNNKNAKSSMLTVDPTFSGVKLFFHFDATDGFLARDIYENSALAYLKRIGDDTRYNLLKSFIHLLSKINSEESWIFAEVIGLQELYIKPFTEIRHIDKSITLRCFENVEYSMQALNMMWRDVCFDRNRRVWVLPENLRNFSMSVYMYDIRIFNSRAKFVRTTSNNDIASINHIMFDLGHCKFDEASGGEFYSSASNITSDMQYTDFKINFEQSDVSGLFKTMTGDKRWDKHQFALAASAASGVNLFEVVATDLVASKQSPRTVSDDDTKLEQVPYVQLTDAKKDKPETFRDRLTEYGKTKAEELKQQAVNRLQNIVSDNLTKVKFDLFNNNDDLGLYKILELEAAELSGFIPNNYLADPTI